MNKKFVLLGSLLAGAVALGSVALASISNNAVLGTGEERAYNITFDSTTISADAYNDTWYYQSFSLSKSNAIVVSGSEKYDLATYDFVFADDYGTHCYGDDIFTFGSGGNLISFTSQGFESIYIVFRLVDYATLDEDYSVINYYVNGTYNNVKFILNDLDETHFYYKAVLDCGSYYGKSINVTSVKIEFTC